MTSRLRLRLKAQRLLLSNLYVIKAQILCNVGGDDVHSVQLRPLFSHGLPKRLIVVDGGDAGLASFAVQPAVCDIFLHLCLPLLFFFLFNRELNGCAGCARAGRAAPRASSVFPSSDGAFFPVSLFRTGTAAFFGVSFPGHERSCFLLLADEQLVSARRPSGGKRAGTRRIQRKSGI